MGGEEGRRRWKTCSSFLLATVVIHSRVTLDEIAAFLSATRAHILVVVLECPGSAVADFVLHRTASNPWNNTECSGCHLGRGVVLLALKPQTSSIHAPVITVAENDVVFSSAKILITHGGAEFRIGVLNVPVSYTHLTLPTTPYV